MAVAGIGVGLDALELVDHGQDQTARISFEKGLEVGSGIRAPDRDVLVLHLAKQSFDPVLELPLELRSIHHHEHRWRTERVFLFQDEAGGGKQGEGFAGPLGVPDKAALLDRIRASRHDAFHGPALVLAQHGFAGLAILDVEENPVTQRAQEIGRLEKRLHREPVALLRAFLPTRHEAARGVPGDPVPVIEEMGDVEQLGGGDQLGRFLLVAPQLGDAPLDGVAVRRVFVLDDGDRHAVGDEHNVCPVALARRGLGRPLPGDVQGVGARCVEVDEPDGAVALLGFVIPLPLAAQPNEHVAVAFNCWRQRLQSLNRGADSVIGHPGIEPAERRLEFAAKQHAARASAPG